MCLAGVNKVDKEDLPELASLFINKHLLEKTLSIVSIVATHTLYADYRNYWLDVNEVYNTDSLKSVGTLLRKGFSINLYGFSKFLRFS